MKSLKVRYTRKILLDQHKNAATGAVNNKKVPLYTCFKISNVNAVIAFLQNGGCFPVQLIQKSSHSSEAKLFHRTVAN